MSSFIIRKFVTADCSKFPDTGELSSLADSAAILRQAGNEILIGTCVDDCGYRDLLECLITMRINADWTGAQTLKQFESSGKELRNEVYRKYLINLSAISDGYMRQDV